jgi:hypothetical protein
LVTFLTVVDFDWSSGTLPRIGWFLLEVDLIHPFRVLTSSIAGARFLYSPDVGRPQVFTVVFIHLCWETANFTGQRKIRGTPFSEKTHGRGGRREIFDGFDGTKTRRMAKTVVSTLFLEFGVVLVFVPMTYQSLLPCQGFFGTIETIGIHVRRERLVHIVASVRIPRDDIL